jgi:AAHS family 3-hydroxyphenylpropionic acid transporter
LRTPLLWLGFFLVQLTFQLLLNWLPLLMQARGLSKNEATFAQICFNLGGVAQALLVGVLLDKPARRMSVVAASMILPSALLLLAISPARSDVVIALTLFLGVISALQLILYSAADAIYPPTARGTGIGAAIGVGRLGAIVGPAVGALLLGAGRTPEQVLTGVLPVVVVCAICVAFLGVTSKRLAH